MGHIEDLRKWTLGDLFLLSGRSKVTTQEGSRTTTQGINEGFWQAEVRTQQTKQLIRDIKRISHRKLTAVEKIRIVLEGFQRDTSIRDLCHRESIRPSTYYS